MLIKRKGSQSLAASLLIRLWRMFLRCLKQHGVAKLAEFMPSQGRSDSRSLRHYMVPLTSRAIPVISAQLDCVKWHKEKQVKFNVKFSCTLGPSTSLFMRVL